MTYVVRHSERVDYVTPNAWKKYKRYRENVKDPPITYRGISIAKKAILKILLDIKYNKQTIPQYIYSSPFARCIDTALVMVNVIELYTGVSVKIRIEPGLREIHLPFIFSTELMDPLMKTEFILKRYQTHFYRFDRDYIPLRSFKDMKNENINIFSEIYTPLNIIYTLHRRQNSIICTHGWNLSALYKLNIKYRIYRFNKGKSLSGKSSGSYCACIKLG